MFTTPQKCQLQHSRVVTILQSLIRWEKYRDAGNSLAAQETIYETRNKTLFSHCWYTYSYI